MGSVCGGVFRKRLGDEGFDWKGTMDIETDRYLGRDEMSVRNG